MDFRTVQPVLQEQRNMFILIGHVMPVRLMIFISLHVCSHLLAGIVKIQVLVDFQYVLVHYEYLLIINSHEECTPNATALKVGNTLA